MVVIFLPAASLTDVWQDRTASPFRCTVQAPHRPAPQPNFVPVICNCSRMAQSTAESAAASPDIFRPLMLRLGMISPCRCMKPLTAATHIFGLWSDTHRADADLLRQNDRLLFRRQCNLELIAKNKISD